MTRAFLAGDAGYDGLFWAGVTSTGIYCRPSCPARKPAAERLEFFDTPAAAVQAGYRACLRCDPAQAVGGTPDWVAPLLARLDAEPDRRITEADLSGWGIEPTRARRWFKARHGLTFASYARARRLQRAQEQLRSGAGLDDVAFGTGWDSHSGFREAYGRQFGGPPGSGRDVEAVITGEVASPLGPLRLGALEAGICLLEFSDPVRMARQQAALSRHLGVPLLPGKHRWLTQLAGELTEYFAGTRREFSVPVVAPGTDFQQRVWTALRSIPYGVTWSYAELARQVGSPAAHRAVGTANGANRVALVIPCHRVVNTGGALGGYGGGLWRKRWLLEREQAGKPSSPAP
jgi:AraC family transcriptional regulator of adaptative response/methylated-DNA-[protein]-cysteine methyltransferase